MTTFHDKTEELLSSLEENDITISEFSEVFEEVFVILEKFKNEASLLLRLQRVMEIYEDDEVVQTLDSLYRIKGAINNMERNIKSIEENFDRVRNAIRTIDRLQEKIYTDVEKIREDVQD